MKSQEDSLISQSNAQFQTALSESARVLLTDPLSDNTKQRQTRLLVAATLLLAVSLSVVSITNAKFPFVETTISINSKSMGIVIAVLTAYFLFSFAAQAILELEARSLLSDQFFLSWKELLDFHSKTVSQSFALDDEMREIWALEGPILTHYRLNDRYQNERLFRLMRNVPRLAEPRNAIEAQKWAHVLLSYIDELHRAFEDVRHLEEAQQKRLQSPEVIARKARFAELSVRKQELLRDDMICSRVERILYVLKIASDHTSRRAFIEVGLPVVFGTLSILVFISRL